MRASFYTMHVQSSEFYSENIGEWVAKGGCKVVQKGFRCFTKTYYWLVKNAEKYGFVNDVPSEPWRWTYVGER